MNTQTKIIGLVGLAGSGKNEAANALIQDGWHQCAFADEIKRIATSSFCWDGQKNYRGRSLLQDLGMLGRQHNPDCWIIHLSNEIIHCTANKIVITDVRFANEAEFVRGMGGTVVGIIRPGMAMERHHSHISESGQWECRPDEVIHNNGTVEDLHKKMREMAATLTK